MEGTKQRWCATLSTTLRYQKTPLLAGDERGKNMLTNPYTLTLLLAIFTVALFRFTTSASAQTHIPTKSKQNQNDKEPNPKPNTGKGSALKRKSKVNINLRTHTRLRGVKRKRNKPRSSRTKLYPRAIKNKTSKKHIHGRLNTTNGKVRVRGIKDSKNVRCNKKCKLIKLRLLWYKSVLSGDRRISDAYDYERSLDKFKKLKYKKKQRAIKQ